LTATEHSPAMKPRTRPAVDLPVDDHLDVSVTLRLSSSVGSQTGSQPPQAGGHARRQSAIVSAARSPVKPHPATCCDAASAPENRKASGCGQSDSRNCWLLASCWLPQSPGPGAAWRVLIIAAQMSRSNRGLLIRARLLVYGAASTGSTRLLGAVDQVPEPPALREAAHHHDHAGARQKRTNSCRYGSAASRRRRSRRSFASHPGIIGMGGLESPGPSGPAQPPSGGGALPSL